MSYCQSCADLWTKNAALQRLAEQMREALREAEMAFMNCAPIKPYSGDGPLVSLRRTCAAYDREFPQKEDGDGKTA